MNVNNGSLCSFTLFYHWLGWEKLQVEYSKKQSSVQKHLETKILFLWRRDFYKTFVKSENTITVVPPIML